MPSTKCICVLANSIKHWPSRCIAGREIIDEGNEYRIGDWVRPINGNSREGELYETDYKLGGYRQPKVFDFINVPIERNVMDTIQPENWTISQGKHWQLANAHYTQPSMEDLVETPDGL